MRKLENEEIREKALGLRL